MVRKSICRFSKDHAQTRDDTPVGLDPILSTTDSPFYRASAKRGIDFTWEYSSNSGNPLAKVGQGSIRSRFLPHRPEFHVCRRDSPAPRYLRVPYAPSVTLPDCNRFATCAGCSW